MVGCLCSHRMALLKSDFNYFGMKTLKILLLLLPAFGMFPFHADAGFEIIGSLTNKYSARKGEKYSAEIKIHNTGKEQQEVQIYQRDYLFNYKGDSFYNAPGSNQRSNAKWIQYGPKTLILKGEETRNVHFEVTVPANDTLVGTYWSVLMVEGVTPPDPNAKGQLKIRTTVRYAVQIVTTIGQTGTGLLEFQHPVLSKKNNQSFFDVVLLNTGQRLISPKISMEIFDVETGKSVKVIKIPRKNIYPTTSFQCRFPLEGLPSSKNYQAVIVADGSGDDVFGLEYTLKL